MELKAGKIHLDESEHEALSLISPMMEELGQIVDPMHFREKLEELYEAGAEKYADLMENRWDQEDQQRRARNNEITQEVLQMFTYQMAQKLSEKFLIELDEVMSEASAPRH